MKKPIRAIILAAGKGARMPRHDLPKVLYPVGGKPMIKYLIESFEKVGIRYPICVVGFKKELVMKELGDKCEYAVQEEQLGTGHAVMAAKEALEGHSGLTFIAYGDMPFWSPETLSGIIDLQAETGVGLVLATVELKDKYPYGRIVRDKQGLIQKIIEEKDCTKEQLKIKELNPSLYLVDNTWLFEALPKIGNDNAKKEYYFTDIAGLAYKDKVGIAGYKVDNPKETIGINNEENIKDAEEALAEFGLEMDEE